MVANKALWSIERNMDRSLSLNSIARACGVSRSHLAHAFGTATGLTVMKYLRARRLSRAAYALANGAPNILAVALDAGYSSHEAFTRAFRDHFSMPPERLRELSSINGLEIMHPLALQSGDSTSLPAPRLERQDRMLVVGLCCANLARLATRSCHS